MKVITKVMLVGISGLVMVLRISYAEVSEESAVKSGYHGGMFFKTPDERFSLKIRTRLQFLFQEDFEEGAGSFRIRRARIELKGNAFYPWLEYGNQLTLEGGTVALRDFYISAKYLKEIYPEVGQFKVPFNREYLTSSSKLHLVDRSIVNKEFEVGRDIGVTLNGEAWILNYMAGLFNGSGKNSANKDKDLLYAGRLVFAPFGRDNYSQGDLNISEKLWLAIGAGIAYFPGYEPDIENTDDRKELAEIEKDYIGEDGSVNNILQFTGDLAFKFFGFNLEGEYMWRSIDPKGSELSALVGNGFRTELGYMILRNRLETAVRYAMVTPDRNVSENKREEWTAGFGYYLEGHNLKVQADYSYLQDIDGDSKTKENRLRAQFQFYF